MKLFANVAALLNSSPAYGVRALQHTASVVMLATEERRKKHQPPTVHELEYKGQLLKRVTRVYVTGTVSPET